MEQYIQLLQKIIFYNFFYIFDRYYFFEKFLHILPDAKAI